MLNEFIQEGDSGAVFSPCGKYRYSLWRRFCPLFVPIEEERLIAYIGLNPSVANAEFDDPTMTRLTTFSKQFGYDGFVMLNLFGMVATDPVVMLKAVDPVGPDNDRAIRTITDEAADVACCWGNHGDHRDRHLEVFKLLETKGLLAFDIGMGGQPKHPLYLNGDSLLDKFIPLYKSHPMRYQIKTFKDGWKPPEGGVDCTRPGRWGNPYAIGAKHPKTGKPITRSQAIELFVELVNGGDWLNGEINRLTLVEELKGKPLGCFCHLNEPCHVDAILRMIDEESSS